MRGNLRRYGPHSSLHALWTANPAELDLESIQSRSLHHQVQAFILKCTHEGTLGPGDRLNESAVSTQLGISRTPVREALTYLESSGLVIRRPRRGFFLAELDAASAHHYYALRHLLEGYASRQVAGRLTEAQVEVLREIIDAMGRAVDAGDWPQAAVDNIAFHETVVSMAGNPMLHRMWISVGPVLWYFDSLTRKAAEPAERADYVQRHEALMGALLRGDPDAAEEAFVAHIEDVKPGVISRLVELRSIKVQRREGR
jgi:DNA-binding GntR family transcriptional regulator